MGSGGRWRSGCWPAASGYWTCPRNWPPGPGCPATGQGRKTDPADAHAIVMVALRDKQLRQVTADPDLTVLRLLCDRRDELSQARAQALNRMHRLFLELIPGGAPVKKSTAQYLVLLASVRPRDPAGEDSPPDGRRRTGRHRTLRCQAQDDESRAQSRSSGERIAPDGHPRHRPGRRRAGSSPTWQTWPDSPTGPTSRPGPAPPPSTLPAASTPTTGCRGPGTAASTTCSTWPGPSNSATTPRPRLLPPPDRRRQDPDGSDALPAPVRVVYRQLAADATSRRAREGTPGRLCYPARPTFPRASALRTSHFPDPHPRRYPRHRRGRQPLRPVQAPCPGIQSRREERCLASSVIRSKTTVAAAIVVISAWS